MSQSSTYGVSSLAGGAAQRGGSAGQLALTRFDADELAVHGSTAPELAGYLFDAVRERTPRNFPYTRQLSEYVRFHVMPETHFVYALTWFSLSIAGVFLTRRVVKSYMKQPAMMGGGRSASARAAGGRAGMVLLPVCLASKWQESLEEGDGRMQGRGRF